jgi:hypothetical protein
MGKVKTVVEHNGVEYRAETMVIRKTTLGMEDHGIFTAFLHCEGGGTGVGVGGYCLDCAPSQSPFSGDKTRRGTAVGMDLIMEIIRVVGCQQWEDLPGKRVLVLFDPDVNYAAAGITSLDTGETLIIADHYQSWGIAEKVVT